jgi:hypothetical protein
LPLIVIFFRERGERERERREKGGVTPVLETQTPTKAKAEAQTREEPPLFHTTPRTFSSISFSIYVSVHGSHELSELAGEEERREEVRTARARSG